MTARTIGVILAAGRSRRMGRNKLLLPWPGRDGASTVIAAAFDSIPADEMIVVVGDSGSELVDALGQRTFDIVNADSDAPMFESIRAGLQAASAADPDASIILLPGDHPAVQRETVEGLLAVASAHPTLAILPAYGGRGGHPALIPASVRDQVIEYGGDQGLKGFWRFRSLLALRVEVSDPGVLNDIDIPEDYERLNVL
jgi:molybdenum cofactor cytidylyltransferase